MATEKTTEVKESSVTVKGSDSTGIIDVIKVYGNGNTVKARNGNDKITVYKGKNHKIYGDDGRDTITVASTAGTDNKLFGGAGNDSIRIQGGSKVYAYGNAGNDSITVKGGNSHVLCGGTGSDTYTLSAAMKETTRLTVNQAGKASGDADILRLTKVNKGEVSFSYNSSKNILTAVHETGGKVYVKNWTVNPLAQVQFANGESVHVIAGNNSNRLNGTSGNDHILAGSSNTTVRAGKGNDTVIVSGGSKSAVNGGMGHDTLEIKAGTFLTVEGASGNDVIRIKGGSGHVIDGGAGNDKIYVTAGSVKTVYNGGGNDTIEIGKSAGNGIRVISGNGDGTLVAAETVKVLGGSSHDIRLYGGNDKIIVAGGKNHVAYTDGSTGSGDAAGNDIIVIQNGGHVKKIVAGSGDDVIAIANGAGNGSTIYTGLEDPSCKNSGTGSNTVNLLGGSGHTVYLGGTKNQVLVEAQDVTLNKYAGTADDITVRWSEEGSGTLRINCPSVSSSQKSTLRFEGVDSWDFSFTYENVDILNANGTVSDTQNALVMTFDGRYTREVRSVTGYYQRDDTGNARLPVYVNSNGAVQYNWCSGNQAASSYTAQEVGYADMPPARIEITHWDSLHMFDGITFDDNTYDFSQICAAATRANHKIGMG